jgi:hypothetical protein
VYRIDPQASPATVYAYRGGSLAHLGHDHVISSHEVQGYVLAADRLRDARADLFVPLARLEIDEPSLRQAAGFAGQLRPDEIAQTREHMLKDVLQAGRYPFLELHGVWATNAVRKILDATIHLHGKTRAYRVPVTYSQDPQRLTVSGQLQIRQTIFDMTPYSVLGGALNVQDVLKVRFTIKANRLSSPASAKSR